MCIIILGGKSVEALMILLCRKATNLYTFVRSIIYPFILRGRSREIYRILPVLVKQLNEADIPYWLGGGIAYDIMRGRQTRPHKDIDFSILAEDVPRVEKLMEANGFSFQFGRHTFYFAIRGSIRVDFFAWRKVGDYRENVYYQSMSRVHDSIFHRCEMGQLEDLTVRLSPVEIMHTFLPIVRNERDQRFIQQLPIRKDYRLVNDVHQVQLDMDCVHLEPIELNGSATRESAIPKQVANS